MGINWGMMLTVFIAIVLAEIVSRSLFTGSHRSEGEASNPGSPMITYANPIDKYLHEKYPNAFR